MRHLVIKLGALGDVILATALIRRLLEARPEVAYTLLTTPAFAPLFAGWSGLEVVAIPRHGARNMWRAVRFMRRGGFSRVYDFQSNDRTGLMIALSGIPERVGNHPRFPYTHHPPTVYRSEIHIFERMNQVLASAGIPPAEPRPHLPPTESDRAHVAAWLAAHDLHPGGFVLCHAGASARWPSKRWPHFAALARRLEREAGLPVVWLGAGEDAEGNRALATEAGIDATGAFSIVQLAEIGRMARFAVTNDSGPMHVLSASGIPVFAFFGPTNWVKNHALGQAERVLRHPVECSPCHRGVCPPEKGHACLAELALETVWERLRTEHLVP